MRLLCLQLIAVMGFAVTGVMVPGSVESMDKPSDRVLKPFTFPGDEEAIRKDWEREHPEEAKWMREWPEGQSDSQIASRMYDAAHRQKAELMASEGLPPEYGVGSELPQSATARANELEREALRNVVRGAAEELPPARAVDSKPFRF